MMSPMTAPRYMMTRGASAGCAASAFRAHSAEMSRNSSMNNIALSMDATLLASIIICALAIIAILGSVLVSALLVLVLLVVLLALESNNTPRSGA